MRRKRHRWRVHDSKTDSRVEVKENEKMSVRANTNQECLILNTISPQQEEIIINDYLNKNKNISKIIYLKNCNDNKLLNQYNKLINLGFTNIYVYIGGLFEWLLLQDIFGDEAFPTTKKESNILNYKPNRLLNV